MNSHKIKARHLKAVERQLSRMKDSYQNLTPLEESDLEGMSNLFLEIMLGYPVWPRRYIKFAIRINRRRITEIHAGIE